MFTRNQIIKEYFRLLDIVKDAEEEREFSWTDENGEERTESFALLDAEEAQRLREEYNERAEAVLRHLNREDKRGAPVTAL